MSLRAGYGFCHLKEIFSPAEIYTEHRYLNEAKFKVVTHSKQLAGFINEPAEIFLSYIPELPLSINTENHTSSSTICDNGYSVPVMF